MIEEIIDKIQNAERKAEEISKTASNKVRQMENHNQIEIEKMRDASLEKIKNEVKEMETVYAEQSLLEREEYVNQNKHTITTKSLAKRMEEAKKHIITEFYKRTNLK